MTQSDKELLLLDLSYRLLYGVKISCKWTMPDEDKENKDKGILVGIDLKKEMVLVKRKFLTTWFYVNKNGCTIKPYLRPISSMTKKEDKEFALLQTEAGNSGFLYPYNAANLMRFLYRHHLDYNGLIEKGLALEAPEDMYKFDKCHD